MLKKRAELAGLLMFVLFLLVLSCGKDNPESPNIDPVASFTVSPAAGTTDTLFHFDASGSSDAEDTPASLQVRWDWENDGTWDTQWSATKTADHQFAAAGTDTIKLEVKDTKGATDDTTQTVAVTAPLSVTVTVPNGGETWAVASTDTIKWTWTGSVGDVKIEYSTDGGSTWSTVVASASNTGSYPWMVPNSLSTTCRVKISSVSTPSVNDIGDADFTIVLINMAPTASFTVSPASGTTETVFQFDASGSSDTEDPLSALQVRWDWQNDGTWDTDWSATKTANHQYGTIGTKTIKALIKDTEGLTDDTTRTVMVGVPPTVLLTSPANGAIDVSPTPIIEVWFSQALAFASLDTLNFHIDGVRSRAIFYDTIERKAILYPKNFVEPLVEHEVHIGANVRNDAGIPMGHEVVFHFTTGALDCDHVRDHFEPNNDIASAAEVSTDGFYPGLTSCGGGEKSDYYRFSLTQTQKIRVIAEIASSDTQSIEWKTNFMRADGKYYTESSTNASSGQAVGRYYTFLPGTYWVELGKYFDDPQIVVYHLKVEELEPAPDDQYEDNDFLDEAAPILAGLHEGLQGASGDADNYAIDLTAGQTITVTATEVTSVGPIRRLFIFRAPDTYCTGHTNLVNPAVESWTAVVSGTYIIHLRWWEDISYNLNVEVED